MIEAVNSVLSNAQVARGSVEQNSQARSIAANPERVQEVAQAPYVSPYIFMDLNYDRAVLQLRDSDTGDVLRQYPSESQLEAYRRAQSTATVERSSENINASSVSQQQPQQPQQSQVIQAEQTVSVPQSADVPSVAPAAAPAAPAPTSVSTEA